MFYGIPFEVETDHQPVQNLATLSDKSNRVKRCFDFLNAYTLTLKHRSKNANANVDVLSRLPLSVTAEDLQPRYRLTDSSDLDAYFVGASGIHPSRLRTSSDASLGRLTTTSGGSGKRFEWTGDNPRRCFFCGGGGSSARVRAKRWSTDVASCVEEIFDGGRGST